MRKRLIATTAGLGHRQRTIAAVFAAAALATPPLAGPAAAAEYRVAPDSYAPLLRGLQAGDTVLLAPGVYRDGLRLHNLVGTAAAPIRIRAADPARRPLFIAGYGRNTVSIVDSDHVAIADIDLDGRGIPVDAVKAEGHARFAHHITLERLRIVNHGAGQQNVGISTKCPAWGWIVRDTEITGAGTGMYFGNSDGRAPFVGGLIEGNRIVDTIGYNLEIKHQIARPSDAGLPAGDNITVIRRNVFSKARHAAVGEMARPNVLVGHLPPTGDGIADRYVIYGNLLHANPTEALFQGEGHIALYNNVFVNVSGSAIHIQRHNGMPGAVDVFGNTIVAAENGIRLSGGDPIFRQRVRNNLVFARNAIVGGDQSGNLAGGVDIVARVLRATSGALEQFDLRPRRPVHGLPLANPAYPEADRDFCGTQRRDATPGAFTADSPATTLSVLRRLPKPTACRAASATTRAPD